MNQSKKSDKEEQKQLEKSAAASEADNEHMSDKEEKKWLERLNLNTPAHIYKLKSSKTQKDNENEKPW